MTDREREMAEAGAGDLLTLWKVGRVELPTIAQVYREAIGSIAPTADAGALSVVPSGDMGEDAGMPIAAVFRAWAEVRDELLHILTVCADRAAGAGEAVGRAISEYTGTDADGTNATTAAGQQLWQMIYDPNEVDPGDPDQNPPAPPGGDETNQPGPLTAAPASRYLPEVTGHAEAIKSLVMERKKGDDQAFQDYVRHRFQDYADEVNASYGEWQHAYEGWIRDSKKKGRDAAGAPVVSPAAAGAMAPLRPSFQVEEAEAYRREVPAAEVHVLDAGHFALDEQPAAIADLTRGFLGRPARDDRLR